MTDPKRGLGDEFNRLWDDFMQIMDSDQADKFIAELDQRMAELKQAHRDEFNRLWDDLIMKQRREDDELHHHQD